MSDSGKRISRYIGLVALSGSLTTFGFVGVSSLASASQMNGNNIAGVGNGSSTNGGGGNIGGGSSTNGGGGNIGGGSSTNGGGGNINGGNSSNGGGGNIGGGNSSGGGGGNIGSGKGTTSTTKAPTTSTTKAPTTTTAAPGTTTAPTTHVTVPVHRVVVPAHRVVRVVNGVRVSEFVPAQVELVSSGTAPTSSALAFTGLNSMWLSLSALMLLLMGAALLQFGRPNSAHAMSLRKQLATIWGHRTD